MIAGLPYDAEVEYLESTGTQWIDTRVIPTVHTGIETDIAITYAPYDLGAISGMCGSGLFAGGGSYSQYIYRSTTETMTGYTWAFGSIGSFSMSIPYGTRTVFGHNFLEDGVVRVDGVQKATLPSNPTLLQYPIALMKLNVANNTSDMRFYVKGRLYHVRISDGSIISHNFVPVRFTNELGQPEGALYDRVSRKLFRNAGTGAFTIGPDVATPVMGLHFMPRPKYTAKSYIRDGLIAMWDGIENAGWGVHDSNATFWKDLVGSDDLIPRGSNGASAEGRYSFDEKCVTTLGNCGFPTSVGAGLTQCTVECVASVSALQSNPASVIGSYAWETGHLCLRTDGTYNNGGITIGYNTAGKLVWYAQSPWNRITGSTAYNMEEKAYFAVVFFGGNAYAQAYRNEERFTANKPSYIAKTGDNFCISGTWSKVGETLSGSFYSVRVHNRALSTSEIAENYAVDKERFNLP